MSRVWWTTKEMTAEEKRVMHPVILALGIAAAVLGLVAFVSQVMHGLKLVEFADETEKMVAAQMLWAGGHLYRDIYASHGPVPYMIAHLYTALVSRVDFSYIRVLQGVLALISTVALWFSPAFRSNAPRLLAVAAYLFTLSTVWIVNWMHMVLYQGFSGFLFVVIVAQLLMPLFVGQRPSVAGLIASGAAATLVFFSGYSFGPAVALLFLASATSATRFLTLREFLTYMRTCCLSILVSTVGVILWLWRFGDIEGYFVYHIYSNQKYYSKFIKYSPALVFDNLRISFSPEAIIHSVSAIILAVSGYVLIVRKMWVNDKPMHKLITVIIMIGAALMTNPRGYLGFADSSFVIVSFAVMAMAAGLCLERALFELSVVNVLHCLMFVAATVGILFQATQVAAPNGFGAKEMSKYVVDLKPKRGGIYETVRGLTKHEGDLLSLIYQPDVYVKSGRLPASGSYYYLPWQAVYNRSPLFGYKLDVCRDIAEKKPAVIWFYNWRVWDEYSLEDYEPCVVSLIRQNYSIISCDSHWYIRNDLFTTDMKALRIDNSDEPWWVKQTMQRGSTLTQFAAIDLLMTPANALTTVPLKRIGVLIATHGTAESLGELRFKTSDGPPQRVQFSSSTFSDNSYHYFDVPAAHYRGGEIVSLAGGGLSTWQSHLENGDTYTCIIYEYTDGRYRFTPGCPIM